MIAYPTSGYTIAPPPRFAEMQDHDCTRCERPEVRPVWLRNGAGQVLPYGSTCAAVLLGRPRSAASTVRAEAEAARALAERDRAHRDEVRASARLALVAHEAGDLDSEVWLRFARNYRAALRAGRAPKGMLLPAYLAQVAATGQV